MVFKQGHIKLDEKCGVLLERMSGWFVLYTFVVF